MQDLLVREFTAMKDWKDDPTNRDWERQFEDQSDGRWHEIHDSSGLTWSANPRGDKDLSEVINEYYHQRERVIQAIRFSESSARAGTERMATHLGKD